MLCMCPYNIQYVVALLLSMNITCCKRVRITVLHKQVSTVEGNLASSFKFLQPCRDIDSVTQADSDLAGLLQRDFASTLESTAGNT